MEPLGPVGQPAGLFHFRLSFGTYEPLPGFAFAPHAFIASARLGFRGLGWAVFLPSDLLPKNPIAPHL